MLIQKEGDGGFMVELTANELQEYHLTYSQINPKNQKTKTLLQTLVSNAGKMMGFQKNRGKLLVEVYPAPLQGCTIYFTNVTARGKRYRKTSPTVFTFETCEDLLQGVACFGAHHPKSEAYRYGDRYLLILHSPPVHGLQEFAGRLPTSKPFLAHIREHGTLLCSPNAVERLQGTQPSP